MRNNSMLTRLIAKQNHRTREEGISLLQHRTIQAVSRAKREALPICDLLEEGGWSPSWADVTVSLLKSQGATWGKEGPNSVLFLNGMGVAYMRRWEVKFNY